MLQCLGAEEEKKLLWLFELRNFFLSFSSKFRAKIFSYIVQRRCRNSKSKRRGFLFNFCFPVFVFTVFCFFLSHHQLERSLILVLWSLTKKFVKPPSLLFIIVKVGGPRSICFSQKVGVLLEFLSWQV